MSRLVAAAGPAGFVVKQDTSTDLFRHARVAFRFIGPLEAHAYFAPEYDKHMSALGLEPHRMAYLAGRAAPLGAVGAGVVAAAFYSFSHSLVRRHIPHAWRITSPDLVMEARREAALKSLQRLLGHVTLPQVIELAGILRGTTSVLDRGGRPLFAAHAEQKRPDDPYLELWYYAGLLREYRGDAHIAALMSEGLSGLQALALQASARIGQSVASAKSRRGFTDEQWEDAVASLRLRGLVGTQFSITQAGLELREHCELATDRMSASPFIALGQGGTERVIELAEDLFDRMLAAGAFPKDLGVQSSRTVKQTVRPDN